ncbi:hydroxyethylthiazole kinase [Escherichia albertii]|nr:hydroxyethylthiazole kinase [Escherichia albertii]EJQ6147061.1 hydroxyethylthiazole kinase [Escherichia albertii]HBM9790211.1 hydroxyethylthiazole kinase [Escherichia albertii]
MQIDLLSPTQSAHALHLFQQHSPLVHCMTNDVVQTFTANTLLALGASPAMVIETEEASQFASIANALLINVGTLTQPRAKAMRAAVEQAHIAQTPWTLDPVAVGALDYRRRFCRELLSLKPAAIRGNASEIIVLAGASRGGRGVDTTDAAADALPAAQFLAQESGAVVAVTGEVDYVTDGSRTVGIHGGSPLMTKVVGTGCALSAVVAASCALPGDTLENVASACHWMKQAGERAVARSEGPGSFIAHFLDALWQLTPEVKA